jgi:hypothetical protein
MRKITGTVKAFVHDTYTTPDMLMRLEPTDALGRIMYYPKHLGEWIECGVAEITVTMFDDDTVKDNLVANLKAEKQKILADAHVAATRIEDRIQSLLAIEDKS